MHAPVSQPLHAVPVEMSAAIHEARASIQQFFDAFAAPRANQGSFFLRVRFTGRSASGDAAAEHL